jgi:hypothetical protein
MRPKAAIGGLAFVLLGMGLPAALHLDDSIGLISVLIGIVLFGVACRDWLFSDESDPINAVAVVALMVIVVVIWHGQRAAGSPTEPVVHIEPERAVLDSIGPNQTLGVYTLYVHNTGREDVDETNVSQDRFLINVKDRTVLGHHEAIGGSWGTLRAKGRLRVVVNLRQLLADPQVAPDETLICVRIAVLFRRRYDGKTFSVNALYGSDASDGGFLYSQDSTLDYTHPYRLVDLAPLLK